MTQRTREEDFEVELIDLSRSLGRAVRLQSEINNVLTSLRCRPPSASSDYHSRPSSDHRPLPPTLSGIRQTLFCFLHRRRRSLIPDHFLLHEIVRDLRPCRPLHLQESPARHPRQSALGSHPPQGLWFDEAHLVRLVDGFPRVLVMDVEKTLKPKLELFGEIGLVETALQQILSVRPVMLRTKVLPKVDALCAYGVPDDVILVLLTRYSYALLTDTARFNETFDKIKKMGICPKKTTFARALYGIAILPEKKWVEKVENFMGLG
ncbi:hypothetical protein ZIOFF_009164 [Zingiber officinale]|uniref:Uncharacterized protein n=1 Tax=Zingiber officinale TaxID=94328 RepID=A0A8J5LIT8_ZINOF|nr:hypothetical protein ZIOFF_009164 [Zingiber officinale]